ncbi:uncharacterized protein LOC135942359 [Cloeon dipterum]|uniref:uncharacterized protein LOC135942359 n=1 Tax=Cloeon dipterum TaxID=197152 RepID=UPI00321FA7B7
MDDNKDAAARREARRRRILQNPEERLRKLKGLSEGDTVQNEPCHGHGHDLPPAKFEPFEAPKVTLPKEESRNTTAAPFDPVPLFEMASSLKTEDDDGPVELSPPDLQRTSLVDRIVSLKLHTAVLAVVVRILLAFNMGGFFGHTILVPLFIIEFPVYVMNLGRSEKGTGLLGAALVLSGIGQSKTHSLLRTVCLLQEIATDVAVYLFVFLLCHATFLWLGIS